MRVRNPRAFQLVVILLLTQMGATAKPKSGEEADLASRSLVIVVDSDAPPQVKAAAEAIRSAANQPLLKLMAGNISPQIVDSQALLKGKYQQRAFNHLIIVGLPQSQLIAQVWQHEASIDGDSLSVFGFGHFKGTLGYIESGRNPFLHSDQVGRAPYETELVTITGTTADGVAMAADAFVHRGILNGVVARKTGWSRSSTSLLDEPPITPEVLLPTVPTELGASPLIGVTLASGDEYRNVLADAGVEPKSIWRFKYYLKGAWDAPDAAAALAEYNAGLHRRAFADTLWAGNFATAEEATTAAGQIADAAGLSKSSSGKWTADGKPGNGTPLELWVKDTTVYMTDLRQ